MVAQASKVEKVCDYYYYTGYTDRAVEGVWRAGGAGPKLAWQPWSSGQPNNAENSEHCARMRIRSSIGISHNFTTVCIFTAQPKLSNTTSTNHHKNISSDPDTLSKGGISAYLVKRNLQT